MKNFIKILLVGTMFLTITSCEDFIGGDVNADPNNPPDIPIVGSFPAFEVALVDVYGGAFSRFNSMLVQQVEGVARQWSSFNQYTGLTPNRFDAAWNNVYENVLNEMKIARGKAQAQNFFHYEGVIDILEAFTLMAAADVWDDMPYSEALQGFTNASPAYDSQESIYSTVLQLLDAGIAKMNGESGLVTPGSEEVFYRGNATSWVKAANAIKARALLHTGDYMGAMAAAQSAFESAADNLQFQYPDLNAAGQWYRFNRDRTGDLEFHPTMRDMMTANNDLDRLAMLDQTFNTSHPYLVADFLQELITYREVQFIIAECAFRNGNADAAHEAYLKGIEASFARIGAGGYADYVGQASIDPGAAGLTLERIMMEKYIAMYLQPENYSDYRRTNVPNLAPVSGANVPVRWDYPSTEYLFNSNAPEDGSVNVFNDRVWWNR